MECLCDGTFKCSVCQDKEETFYCGICELEHELSNTSCVQPDPDYVLMNYEDKHGE